MTAVSEIENDGEYDQLLQHAGERFEQFVGAGRPLFSTDATGLMAAYLDNLPTQNRQYHTCNACRRFMENYGGLVVIGEDGRTESAVWDLREHFPYYHAAIETLRRIVRKAKVTGVFLSSDRAWGTASNPKGAKHGGVGEWSHYHLRPPASILYGSAVKTPFQAMAEKAEDRKNVLRALGEFSLDHLRIAVKILAADALYRSEKVLGAAEWLLWLAERRGAAQGKDARENLTWLAVAQAPAGFCHPRSSMIGTLLEDLESGMGFEQVASRFKAKMAPTQYQRPQAAPTSGAIRQAEELFEKLGLGSTLRRRFARLEEIDALWRPVPEQPKAAGSVFGHLQAKGEAKRTPIELPEVSITWAKFRAEVLPVATRISALAPSHGNYTALVTAADPEAPPILQWDNPFSLYVYSRGSTASQWGLREGWVAVNAVALRPHEWFGNEGKYKHLSSSLIFVLDGARESRLAGLALFPEILRSELHGVRSVIEAHSRSGKIEGAEEGSACGLMGPVVQVRVADADGDHRRYKIDRWD